MKKVTFTLIAIFISIITISNVSASNYTKEDLKKEIEIYTNQYLEKNNIQEMEQLSPNQEKELISDIQVIKDKYYKTIQPRWFNPWEYATSENLAGLIFVTMDSSHSGWNHGHAGIGYSTGGKVIEANKGVGVKLYNDRVNGYWSGVADGGIYKVDGASSSDYNTAKNYAYKQIGKDYSLWPMGDGSFYCSELVYKSWKEAGFTIATNTGYYLPSSIMNHANTYKVASFPF